MSQMMHVTSLGRVVHDRHHNPARFPDEDPAERLIVPGPLVLAAVNSCAGRELHEVLFQTMHQVNFTNVLHPNEVVTAATSLRPRRNLGERPSRADDARRGRRRRRGPDDPPRGRGAAVVRARPPRRTTRRPRRYVLSRSESLSGELEKLEVATLGLKNIPGGGAEALREYPLPRGLFVRDAPLRTDELVDALADHPLVKPENVVCQAFRSVYRQAPKAEPFLL